MGQTSIYSRLVHMAGAWSTAYGPFVLRSALQPIFRRISDDVLDVYAFQGLVRAERNEEPYPPSQFFPLVEPRDLASVDSLLRSIHILNVGSLNRARSGVFVSFQPQLYSDPAAMRLELDRIRLAGHEVAMQPDRIVCDINTNADDGRLIASAIRQLRQAGFRISISNYEASETSIEVVRLHKPDFVRFDGDWVRDYMHNSAGFALLRVIVRQLRDDGIEPIFERLEENWQVELCTDLGVTLLQGYALARPQLAPTDFNEMFPEVSFSPTGDPTPASASSPLPKRSSIDAPAVVLPQPTRPSRVFGKRGSNS